MMVFVVLVPIGCLAFGALAFAWRDPLVRTRRMQRITVAAYRLLHDWLRIAGIVDFDYRTELGGMPGGPCVVVANHPTLVDVTAISAVIGGGCTVVKPKLYRSLLLRGLLAGAGHIPGSRDDPVSVGTVVDQALRRISEGYSVIVFPEGTRSPAGGMHAFGRAAFEIACRASVPLACLTVECVPLYLSKEVPVMRPPHPTPRLHVELLAVEDVAGYGRESRALHRRTEQRYRAWYTTTKTPQSPILPVPTPEGRTCQMISKTG